MTWLRENAGWIAGALVWLAAWAGIGVYLDARRFREWQSFLVELDQRCVAKAGERAISENDGRRVHCQKERLLPPGLRYPWR